MSDRAQDLVRRLFDAINGQEYEALPEVVSPDYVYRAPGEEVRGVEGLRGVLAAYHRGFPDLELVIDDMFGGGDRVATAFTFNGTHLGELMGVPATGRRVSVSGTIHSRAKEGRIVEEFELLDLATMYRQLGLVEGEERDADPDGLRSRPSIEQQTHEHQGSLREKHEQGADVEARLVLQRNDQDTDRQCQRRQDL